MCDPKPEDTAVEEAVEETPTPTEPASEEDTPAKTAPEGDSPAQ